MESMVGRVVRQIRDTLSDADITFATNSSQKDILINQLGDEINIVIEPERRDTFPAIALACSSLYFQRHCPADEVVVIMPCDPYTESGYFETVGKMADVVAEGSYDLVLMGVKPDCPSSKYGYVVPQYGYLDMQVQPVAEFVEKPDTAAAKELLAKGAYWNGGVFAFRLGYLLDIVRGLLTFNSFEDVLSGYSNLPKISFDYQVAEKASSVAMVPFSGEWKDLGTWNSLTEKLARPVVGNGKLGPNCTNVHIVNELSLPVFVDGLENSVIAASPDGILVCGKNESENIKKYVGDLSMRPMYEERRWGSYRVVDSTVFPDGWRSLTKSITLRSGKNISYQIHEHRDEVWTFVDGKGLLMIDDEVQEVSRGCVAHISKGHKHAVKALSDLTFIEVQSGELLSEDDIERLWLDWPEE